jgi:hypothetical protein
MIIAQIGVLELTEVDLLAELRLSMRLGILEDLINHQLVSIVCDESGLHVSAEDEQEWRLAFCRQNKIVDENGLEAWAQKHHLTQADLSELARRSLRLNKLKNYLFEDKLDKEFALRRLELEKVEYYRIVLPREDIALEVAAQIRDGADFLAMARSYSTEKTTAKIGGYAGIVNRASVRPEIEAVLYASTAGVPLGPIKSLGSYQLVMLEATYPGTLDEQTRAMLRETLFMQWLVSERQKRGVRIT